jgi:hypothetical protein
LSPARKTGGIVLDGDPAGFLFISRVRGLQVIVCGSKPTDMLKHPDKNNIYKLISGSDCLEETLMRSIFSLIAAIALTASVSTASAASAAFHSAPSWHRAIQCSEPGGPCASGSDEAYNHCTDLALARGESLNKGDRHDLDYFVYQCLAGHIPE